MIRIRAMTEKDLPLGLRLKQQAGWNQTEGDWLRCLDLEPDGCFVAELDGKPVGTTTTCIFGPVAWVGMVVVDTAARGKGVATELMKHALAYLDGQGVRTVRLDATPLGKPVYEKLGFGPEYELARYEGTCPASPSGTGVEPIRAEQLKAVVQLDREMTGTDRVKLLTFLFEERPDAMRGLQRDGKLAGYGGARIGSKAVQIGPCVADAEAGSLLLADACHRYSGRPVYIDIPLGNKAAAALAESKGLKVQRNFLRMCRGPAIVDRVEGLWASFGPEKG